MSKATVLERERSAGRVDTTQATSEATVKPLRVAKLEESIEAVKRVFLLCLNTIECEEILIVIPLWRVR